MKRLVSVFLIMVLLTMLIYIPVRAEGEVFVAAGNTVLPLTGAMPIKSNGVWYVDYKCFTKGGLGINASYNSTERKLVLYTWDTTLIFDLNDSTAYTVRENVKYKAAAVAASGTVYIPVPFTSQILGLEYSYDADIPMLRIKKPSDIPNNMFVYIAKNEISALLKKYEEEEKAQASAESSEGTHTEENDASKTRSLRLTFNITDGKNFAKILSALSRSGYRATFFISSSAIASCENEIRRAYALGHRFGILAGSVKEMSVTNEKLFDVAKIKTRVVRFTGGSEALSKETVESVVGGGFRIWDFTVSPDGKTSNRVYSQVTSALSKTPRSPVLAISDSDAAVGALSRIFTYLGKSQYNVYAVSVLDTPINRISERR